MFITAISPLIINSLWMLILLRTFKISLLKNVDRIFGNAIFVEEYTKFFQKPI